MKSMGSKMKMKDKIKLIDSFSSIFSIKLGKIVQSKTDKKCYYVAKPISSIFGAYYYGGINSFLLLIIFLLLPNILNSLLVTIIIATVIYLIFELFLFLIVPLKEIECWKKHAPSNLPKPY